MTVDQWFRCTPCDVAWVSPDEAAPCWLCGAPGALARHPLTQPGSATQTFQVTA